MSHCPIPKCSSQLSEGSIYCHYHSRKLGKAKKVTDPVSKVSEKQTALNKAYKIIADAYKAAHPICQAALIGCTKATEDCHHSAGRVGANLLDESKFIAVCRHCHQVIESSPVAAKALGLSISRLSKTEDEL